MKTLFFTNLLFLLLLTNSFIAQCESIKKGKTFTIELPSRPTTGYSWQLVTQLSPKSKIKIISTDIKTHGPGNVCGGPATQIWKIKGIKKGMQTLVFEEKRPWLNELPINTKALVFVVK